MNPASIAAAPRAPRAVIKDKFRPVLSHTPTEKRDSYCVFQRIATLIIAPRVFRTPVCPLCQNNSAFNICIVKYVWESFTELSRTPRKFTDVIQSPYYLSKREQLRGKSEGGRGGVGGGWGGGGNTNHGGYSGFFPAVCLLNLIEPSLQIHLHLIHKLISRKPRVACRVCLGAQCRPLNLPVKRV